MNILACLLRFIWGCVIAEVALRLADVSGSPSTGVLLGGLAMIVSYVSDRIYVGLSAKARNRSRIQAIAKGEGA